MAKRIRGIIVWDFDGVLFDIERFRKNAEHIFEKYGVPPAVFQAAILRIRKEGGQFSVARSFRIMRSLGASVKEKSIRKFVWGAVRSLSGILQRFQPQENPNLYISRSWRGNIRIRQFFSSTTPKRIFSLSKNTSQRL